MPGPRIYSIRELPSIAGPGEETATKEFSFSDSPSKKCFTIPAGVRILTCQIIITTPFNNANTTLTVGDGTTPNKYMTAGQNMPNALGENESNPYEELANDTDIHIYINLNGATLGAGVVVIEYDQPIP